MGEIVGYLCCAKCKRAAILGIPPDWLARFRVPVARLAFGGPIASAAQAHGGRMAAKGASNARSRRLNREVFDIAPSALMLFGAGLILIAVSAAVM